MCGHGEGRLRYTYYLLSTLLGRDQRLKRTYLWWGRYLTQFQMFQFVTNMGQVRSVWLPPPSVLSVISRFFSAAWSAAAPPVAAAGLAHADCSRSRVIGCCIVGSDISSCLRRI